MAMMLVSEEAFDKELNKDVKIESKVVDINRGRGNKTEVSEEKRKQIASEVIETNKTQKEIAIEFGVSTASVSAYANGATSTASYNNPDEQLKKHVDETKVNIGNIARGKLLEAINELTPERVRDSKTKDIASIARDMSVIAKNMEPELNNINTYNNQVLVYRPQVKLEEEFDSLTVNE